jgi:hypothetical protein
MENNNVFFPNLTAEKKAEPIFEPPKKRKSKAKTALIVVGVSIMFAILLIGAKLYQDSQKQLSDLRLKIQNPTAAKAQSDQDVVDRVNKHMVLPNEVPKIVTIADVDKIKTEQPFFAQAENGDILLVYSQKVILYSPTLDKVIEVAQIKYGAVSPTGAPTVAPTVGVGE